MKIPVIINNRDLLTWPRDMVEVLKTFDNIGDIIIHDNASTYQPLLDWYDTNPCEIVKSYKNLHQSGVWQANIPQSRDYEYYVVTDPDLDLSQTPKDCLNVLVEKMEKYKEYGKIGLAIDNYRDPMPDTPWFYTCQAYAHQYLDQSLLEDGLLKGHIVDTTFAMYNEHRRYQQLNCSLNFPYSVNHIPYLITNDVLNDLENLNYEFFYYLKNASSASSYKMRLDFDKKYNLEKK